MISSMLIVIIRKLIISSVFEIVCIVELLMDSVISTNDRLIIVSPMMISMWYVLFVCSTRLVM